MVTIHDPHDELGGIVPEINEVAHIESLLGILDATFHRCHMLARLALAAGDVPARTELATLAAKLRAILDIPESEDAQ